jgi:hypothetical protein
MALPPDYDDACAMLEVLKPAYYSLLGGTLAQEVEFRAGNGTVRRTKFTATNIAALRNEIANLETKCAAQSGKTRRHTILAG